MIKGKNVKLLLSGFLCLWSLGSVERAGLSPSLNTCRIQSAPKDVVTYTRKVLYTTSTHEHD